MMSILEGWNYVTLDWIGNQQETRVNDCVIFGCCTGSEPEIKDVGVWLWGDWVQIKKWYFMTWLNMIV